MRRHHFAGICVVSTLWVLVIYLLLLDNPSPKFILRASPNLPDDLRTLEDQIKQEYKENENLLQNVKNAIVLQNEQNRAEAEEKALVEEESAQEKERLLMSLASHNDTVAVLVFACNRVTVSRCLDQLIRYRPSQNKFPIVVTQDCQHEATSSVIRSYGSKLFHIQQPDQSEITVPPKEKKFRGYFKIARHYGWALNQIFHKYNFSTAIIIEDDLDVSPDIFNYFNTTRPLLTADPSLWCVSAWNDNGKVDLVDKDSPHLLYRSDFFPGLGWMLLRSTWDELSSKWPRSYWDDWIRQPEQRKGRACIRPEVSRTRTFGKIGVSNGLFFEKHLKYIHLNDKPVDFSSLDLTYLLKDKYDAAFVKDVYESPIITYQELKAGNNIVHSGSVRIPYHSKLMFRAAAKALGLMDDFRSGVPRTGYRGVVSFFYRGRRVYLAPPAKWRGYDTSWN